MSLFLVSVFSLDEDELSLILDTFVDEVSGLTDRFNDRFVTLDIDDDDDDDDDAIVDDDDDDDDDADISLIDEIVGEISETEIEFETCTDIEAEDNDAVGNVVAPDETHENANGIGINSISGLRSL